MEYWTYFVPEDHGLKQVAGVDWFGDEGCYEWEETTVMWDPKVREFVWHSGYGCSCDGPLQDVRADELERGNLQALSTYLTKYFIDNSKYWSNKRIESVTMDIARVIEAAMRMESA